MVDERGFLCSVFFFFWHVGSIRQAAKVCKFMSPPSLLSSFLLLPRYSMKMEARVVMVFFSFFFFHATSPVYALPPPHNTPRPARRGIMKEQW